jgi:hypothetical protein
MKPVPIRWRLIQWLIFRIMAKSARTVLINRTLVKLDGEQIRWLRPEIDKVIAEIQIEVQKNRAAGRLEELTTFGNRLMVEFAVYTVSGYKVLRRSGLETNSAMLTLSDIGWNIYRKMLTLSSMPSRIMSKDPTRRLTWTIKVLLWFPFNNRNGIGYRVKHWTEDGAVNTVITHCPPQSFARRIAEIDKDQEILDSFYNSWCLYDWPGADVIADDGLRGHYRRSLTLSRGDQCCDMCWHGSARASQLQHYSHGSDRIVLE